jgi:hypothetical protein
MKMFEDKLELLEKDIQDKRDAGESTNLPSSWSCT